METAEIASTRAPNRDIYSVSRLNREVRVLLERGFGSIWLEAEISNLAKPEFRALVFLAERRRGAGTLRMFRQRNMLCAFTPRDGQKVLVRARIGLYEPRGEYQLIIDHMEDAGPRRLEAAIRGIIRQTRGGRIVCRRAQASRCPACRGESASSPRPPAPRFATSCMCWRGAFPAAAVLIYPVAVQGARRPRKSSRRFESPGGAPNAMC